MRRTFFRPERPTLTSRSLQSITRPFQKRFRKVFGNSRILIFYLSIKAWEQKSLPKSHLGWFFLVFGEGKATKKLVNFLVHVTFKLTPFNFLTCGNWRVRNFNVSILTRAIFMPDFYGRIMNR